MALVTDAVAVAGRRLSGTIEVSAVAVLSVPIVWPSEYHDRIAERQKLEARRLRRDELVIEAQG